MISLKPCSKEIRDRINTRLLDGIQSLFSDDRLKICLAIKEKK